MLLGDGLLAFVPVVSVGSGQAREPARDVRSAAIELVVGLAMQDPLRRGYYYRQKAMECHDLANTPSSPSSPSSIVATRCATSMAEEILNEARARGEIANEADRRAAPSERPLGISAIGRP